MSAEFMQNMAPNAKRSFFVTFGLAVAAVGIYFFAVEPGEADYKKAQKRLADAKDALNKMTMDFSGVSTVKNRLDEDYKAMEPIRNALLVPLRGSYKMAALAQVEPLMLDAGLTAIKPDDAPFRALPLVNNAVPEQLYGRAAVKFTARGSYQAAISFLLKLERDLPLVSLQAIEITAQQDPDNQAIMFILEWPTLGKKTTNEGKVAKK